MPSWLFVTEEEFSGISYRIELGPLPQRPGAAQLQSSICPQELIKLSIPILTAQSRMQNNHGVL